MMPMKSPNPLAMQPPVFADVLAARNRIRPHLPPTPLHHYPALDHLLGFHAYIKHENHQPVGAFKVRGGINLALQLSEDERQRGLIAASTGNHGQSVAYAGRLVGAPVIIVAPEDADPGKVNAMRGLGAEVILTGATFDEARIHCETLVAEHGYRYVHSGNERHLIAGVGTHALEMLESEPELDAIIVPLGGGSGAAGACISSKHLSPRTRVIAVQSAQSPAGCRSWHTGELQTAANECIFGGLATGDATAFAMPFGILHDLLDDFVLVEDEAILQAMAWLLQHAHTLAEGAGAASLAAAHQLRGQLQGQRVGLICSGGNAAIANLQRALSLLE